MTELQIDIKRTGFPIKFGSVELWFDSSMENLRRFFNIEEIVKEKVGEAQAKAKHINFPDEITFDTLEVETVDAVFDIQKESIAVQYDIIFGEGTFERIYKIYPDIFALEQALDVVGNAIAERIETQEIERLAMTEDKKNEYLNKKNNKTYEAYY